MPTVLECRPLAPVPLAAPADRLAVHEVLLHHGEDVFRAGRGRLPRRLLAPRGERLELDREWQQPMQLDLAHPMLISAIVYFVNPSDAKAGHSSTHSAPCGGPGRP